MYSSVVISRGDLNKIKNEIVSTCNDVDVRRSFELNLKSLSQAKMKAWPDSVVLANKNHSDKLKRSFIEQESMKRKIDEEERKYSDILKNRMTNKARELLFYSQDPVKSFVSKMLYSDILQERKVQLRNKEVKRERNKQYDAYWDDVEKKKMYDYDIKQLSKVEVERRKKQGEFNVINQQFSEAKIKQVQDIQERFIEGQIIKKNALKAIEEEKEKEEAKKEEAQKQNEEFIKANAEIERLKAEKKKSDEEEERKIEDYAKRKQQLVDLRKKKEIEKAKEKQDQRQKLIDRQIENLAKLKTKEETVLTKHIEDTEKKKAMDEAEKKAKYDKMQNDINEDRSLYMKRVKETKQKEKKEDYVRAQAWRQEVKLMEEEERRNYMLKRKKQKELAEYQLRQAKEKREKALEQFSLIQEDSFLTKKMISNEQDNFISFAEEQIKEYVKQGKEIFPLLNELKNYKKNNS